MTNLRLSTLFGILIISVVSALGVIIIGYLTLKMSTMNRYQPPPAQTQSYSPPQNQNNFSQ